jgi:hypothetical protein
MSLAIAYVLALVGTSRGSLQAQRVPSLPALRHERRDQVFKRGSVQLVEASSSNHFQAPHILNPCTSSVGAVSIRPLPVSSTRAERARLHWLIGHATAAA